MDGLQSSTQIEVPEGFKQFFDKRELWLGWAQDQFVSYTAYGGLIPDEDGEKIAVRLTMSGFAKKVGVSRQSLYAWRESIPGFWDLVAERRKLMGSRDRLTRVWNGVYMKATTGNPEAAKLYLANFDPDFKMPTQKHEVEAGDSLVEAIGIARARKATIEGEVVDEPAKQA